MPECEKSNKPLRRRGSGAQAIKHDLGQGDDLGTCATQPPPEWLEGVHAFAVADEYHGAGEQIDNHGHVAVSLGDSDFIDGDLRELVQLGLAEAALQGTGLDILDGVPTDVEVLGHVLNGHQARQVEDIAFERAGAAFLGIGEAQLDLPDHATGEAEDAGHLELHEGWLGADGNHAKGAFDAPLAPGLAGAALGAAVAFARFLDAKRHLPLLEGLADVVVADNAEAVIQ